VEPSPSHQMAAGQCSGNATASLILAMIRIGLLPTFLLNRGLALRSAKTRARRSLNLSMLYALLASEHCRD
jgi:hypothetical protein